MALWRRFIKYFRRFRFLTTALRIAPWLLLAISTHTLLYVVMVVAILLIPILFLCLLSPLGSVFVRHRHMNARFETLLAKKTVFVLFPMRGAEFKERHFWQSNARDLAKRKNCAVIIVSPYWLSSYGLKGRDRFYFNAREEDKSLFIVRRHYFFSLRKNVLTRCVGRLILIY